MKNLHIPVKSEQSIDISEINCDFPGLIIAYKGDKATGYIQHYDASWIFLDDISAENGAIDADTLLELITMLMKRDLCTHFKVIEFD